MVSSVSGGRPSRRGARGLTVLELLFTVSLAVVLSGIAIPLALTGLDRARTAAAAYYMAGRLRGARMDAVKRSAAVGFHFEGPDAGYRYTVYVDGNGNGIRTAEIRSGIDAMLALPERIGDLFAGVSFGLVDGVPLVDGPVPAEGEENPLRIGTARIVTFTPRGTATPGTLYLRGRSGRQLAVRILGATGRTRVMEFDAGTRRWITR